MYKVSWLGRYAETIDDARDQMEFQRRIGTIASDHRGVCPGGAVEGAFEGALPSVQALIQDFHARYLSFVWGPEELRFDENAELEQRVAAALAQAREQHDEQRPFCV